MSNSAKHFSRTLSKMEMSVSLFSKSEHSISKTYLKKKERRTSDGKEHQPTATMIQKEEGRHITALAIVQLLIIGTIRWNDTSNNTDAWKGELNIIIALAVMYYK